MDEVELVLLFVEVRPRLDPGWDHKNVRAKRRDAELLPHLAEDAVPHLVDRPERVPHGTWNATAVLIYSVIASLDGYIEDASGGFGWAAPDDEVHAFVNDLERSVGTHLYGRRMYETMVYWEDPPGPAEQWQPARDYARIWQAADKVVYSKTLPSPSSARTRIEREFDVEAVRQLKETASRDLSVGGPELAAQAIAAGLVDEFHLFLVPIVVGGGKRALPEGVRLTMELLDERRFGNGTVYLQYRVEEVITDAR